MADGRDENDVGIAGIDYDPRNPACFVETHVSPGLASVSRLIDAVADRDIAANEALAGAGPDDVVVGWSDCERTYRGCRLLIENRRPVGPAVFGFPNSA